MGAFLGPERKNSFGFPLEFTSLLLGRLWETCSPFPFPWHCTGQIFRASWGLPCKQNLEGWLINLQKCNFLRFLQVSPKFGGVFSLKVDTLLPPMCPSSKQPLCRPRASWKCTFWGREFHRGCVLTHLSRALHHTWQEQSCRTAKQLITPKFKSKRADRNKWYMKCLRGYRHFQPCAFNTEQMKNIWSIKVSAVQKFPSCPASVPGTRGIISVLGLLRDTNGAWTHPQGCFGLCIFGVTQCSRFLQREGWKCALRCLYVVRSSIRCSPKKVSLLFWKLRLTLVIVQMGKLICLEHLWL